MSFKAEVLMVDSEKWVENGLRFRTRLEATEYALALRVQKMRVRASRQAVNARWVDHKVETAS